MIEKKVNLHIGILKHRKKEEASTKLTKAFFYLYSGKLHMHIKILSEYWYVFHSEFFLQS